MDGRLSMVIALFVMVSAAAGMQLHEQVHLLKGQLADEIAQGMIHQLDSCKKDKVLDMGEFLTMSGLAGSEGIQKEHIMERLKIDEELASTMMGSYDEDEDGILGSDEFITIFEHIDTNGDKTLTASELVEYGMPYLQKSM